MKKIFTGVMLAGLIGLTTACFKDTKTVFDGVKFVEFESAVRLSPAVGATFPIISVKRTDPSIMAVINLVGSQLKATETMKISIDTAIAPFLNATTIRGVEGKHFSLNGGSFTFKTDTSFNVLRLPIPTQAADKGKSALFVLKLDGSDGIKPSENYRRVGYRIALD